MQKYREYFKDKKITVMGLGLLGRGVGDVAFLAECGADLIVTDMKSEEALSDSLTKLKGYENIKYSLGGHNEEDFKGRELILKAAGVPLDSSYIEIARNDEAEIAMSGALFAKLSGIPVIGITGTRGKSTVTHMIHHVLTQMTEGAPVLLGGNVRGVSNLQLLKDAEPDSIAVMELDSWQLQGFGEYKISPHVAVFTNFMEDHMNYYKGDMDAYFKDKAHIFLHQEESGVFVTTQEVFDRAQKLVKDLGEEMHQEVRLADASLLPEDYLLSMPGEHNRLNAALATEALKATGLTEEEIFTGLATFPGVPGRLEYLGEKDGIRIYNDNNATTPQATIAGITAVARNKNVLLIAGGADKQIDLKELVKTVHEQCKSVFLIPGSGTDKFKELLEENSTVNCTIFQTLGRAVEAAFAAGKPGEVLLFSPAFASFGQYNNEYERNDEFNAFIQALL